MQLTHSLKGAWFQPLRLSGEKPVSSLLLSSSTKNGKCGWVKGQGQGAPIKVRTWFQSLLFQIINLYRYGAAAAAAADVFHGVGRCKLNFVDPWLERRLVSNSSP
jgi:hypothetical protein